MTGTQLLFDLQSRGLLRWPIDFEANDVSDEDLQSTFGHWFIGDKWKASPHRFKQFGQDGTGSLYCLWFYEGLEGEPPVVFFGSEGDTGLVADSAADFARLFGAGQDWYPFQAEWRPVDTGYIDPEDEDALDLSALRAAVEAALGPWTESPAELLARAKARHPDFNAWVAEMAP